MKHLFQYKGYGTLTRLNDILDKINKYGCKSLTKNEIKFLDSHKENKQEIIHQELIFTDSNTIFKDDNDYFIFEYQTLEYDDDSTYYIGVLYVPDLICSNGKKIKGRLEGRIVVKFNGAIIPEFYSPKKKHDVFEFCSNIESELDEFLEYVVNEIKNNMNFNI
ncbi:MAG: hypothetical protein M0R46_06570 [Candidatus Muirbacterium halophilum]|nr:hypothetical protein [Candidatus Muirbacterium halophilum]